MTLSQHIKLMRGCAQAAVEMVVAGEAETMAGNVIEDIVVKTLSLVHDNPTWPDDARKRPFHHSPPLPRTTPPPKKPRKTIHTPVGDRGEHEKIITLDDIKL